MKHMKTQLEHAETARRKVADRMHGFNFLMQQPHGPTAEEIEKLRSKRPGLWNGYPDKNPPKAAQTA